MYLTMTITAFISIELFQNVMCYAKDQHKEANINEVEGKKNKSFSTYLSLTDYVLPGFFCLVFSYVTHKVIDKYCWGLSCLKRRSFCAYLV